MNQPIRIVFLSPFFHPEAISTGKYNRYVAQELVAEGAELHVVCSHPLYPNWRPEHSDVTMDGMTIHRGGEHLHYPRSVLLRRAVLEAWFTWHALRTVLPLRDSVDMAVAVFPPSLFFYFLPFILPKRVRKVGIVHDLQGVYARAKKGMLSGLISAFIRHVERGAFAACDSLLFLSRYMRDECQNNYGLNADRLRVCYPFVTIESPLENQGKSLEAELPAGLKHVVYSGALGEKQNPNALLDLFMAAAVRMPDVCFHMFSAGPIFEELVKRVRDGMGRVQMHPLVDEADLPELYSRSTVQFIAQAEGTSGGSLPSKLPNIVASGAAVFCICDPGSEIADLLAGTGTAVVEHIWDRDYLVNRLQTLLRSDVQTHAERRELAANLIAQEFQLSGVVAGILGTYRGA